MLRNLALAAAAAFSIAAAPPEKTCAPLRVMTYNIRLDLESDGINRWSNRRDQFIGQVALMHPAILGLQEVVPGQKADLERALPDYAFLGTPREEGGEVCQPGLRSQRLQAAIERHLLAFADAQCAVEGLGRGLQPSCDLGAPGSEERREEVTRSQHASGQ